MHACASSRGAQLDEMRTEDGRVRKQEASSQSQSQSHLINGTEPNPTDRRPGDRSMPLYCPDAARRGRRARARHVMCLLVENDVAPRGQMQKGRGHANQPTEGAAQRNVWVEPPPCPRSTQSPTVRVLKLLRYRVNQPNFKRTLSRTLLKSRARARSPHRPRSNQPAS
jgi:hypothetical protein